MSVMDNERFCIKKNMNRMKKLREKAVNPAIIYDEFYFYFYTYMQKNENVEGFKQRYAKAYKYALENVTPCIDEGELIVGKCCKALNTKQQDEWNVLREYALKQFPCCGQDSHMAVDYELVLNKGLVGILDMIDLKIGQTIDDDKLAFYNTCKACLKTVIKFSQKYAAYAEELAEEEADDERKAELRRIADICNRVPENPATGFYDAVQSVHFITFCLSMDPLRMNPLQFQLGHPDRYLLKYYLNDLQADIITSEYAQLLLDCLGIQVNNRVPHGLSSGYMVGGRDDTGSIVANELTEMCMNVVDNIRLVYPAVGLCYTKDMPDQYLKRACEILSHGCSHPAIFNDDIISQGLQLYGVPENESHDYIQSTCVEITPVAASNIWVASPYINLVKPLLESMNQEYKNMDAFMQEIYKKLDCTIAREFESQNKMRKIRAENCMNPLLSCLVNDCLERGIDIECGGARYNWIMPSFVGLANLADSLVVIESLVFGEEKYTITDLKKMTECNFKGFEMQRMELLNRIPKYGNDDDTVDKWCCIIADHIASECKKYIPILPNAKFVPSVFCWIMHTLLGEETGATPDGRMSGFPLGDGSGPAQGREKNGPTASIISSTKWSHKEFIGGVAVNMKFSKKAFENDAHERMMSLIKTYIMRGGFEIQINVVDRNTLLEARKNPEQYKDIVVRIGGYSDYFVSLSDKMQEEILLRTEHDL